MWNKRLRVTASYYQGWLDASFEVMRGNLSFSFYRHLVDGLSEYARETDGIEICFAPATVSWAPLYYEGFNRRMLSPIRKKVGSEFPDGYIQNFLRAGWLDITAEQPDVCPVHRHEMRIAVIPFEMVYPMTITRSEFDWEEASEAQFPFPGATKKVDASILPRPRNARLRICEECTKAESEWWMKHKTPNKAPEPTPTAVTPRAIE
jgi:hypothetical protein